VSIIFLRFDSLMVLILGDMVPYNLVEVY
jgi:hypothetical protein